MLAAHDIGYVLHVAKDLRYAFVAILNHDVSTPTMGGCNCDDNDVADV